MFILQTFSWAKKAMTYFDISYETGFSFKYTIWANFHSQNYGQYYLGEKL